MINRVFFLFIISMTSLCSISYEVILARFVSIILDNEVLGQSLTISIFLLGMGIGSITYKRKKGTIISLFRLEITIATIASLTPLFILMLITFLDAHNLLRSENIMTYRNDYIFMIVESFVFIIGFLTGVELPIFLDLNKEMDNPLTTEKVLFFNYFGSLISIFFIFLYLDNSINSLKQVIYFSIYNSIVVILILPSLKKPMRNFVFIMIPIISQIFSLFLFPTVYEIYKKTYYFSFKINKKSPNKYSDFLNVSKKFGKIKSIQTKYQEIDLVESQNYLKSQIIHEYSLYLDRKPQFSTDNVIVYHQSFAHVPFNLTGSKAKNALILGGGDGLLARELLRRDHITNIKIVELDEKMVSLAKKNHQLLHANFNSLENLKVDIYVEDALNYISSLSSNSIDAIFIDFPYPNNYELLKLYSYEFYREIHRVLSPSGFVILDAPVISKYFPNVKNNSFLQILFNTTKKADFKTFFSFGPSEPFVILMKKETRLRFDYSGIDKLIDKRVFTNLIGFENVVNKLNYDPKNINSIFKPGIFDND